MYASDTKTLEQVTEPPTAPRASHRRLLTAPSVCALEWVKCREHISLLVIFCIILYVTNKQFFFFKRVYIYKVFYIQLYIGYICDLDGSNDKSYLVAFSVY